MNQNRPQNAWLINSKVSEALPQTHGGNKFQAKTYDHMATHPHQIKGSAHTAEPNMSVSSQNTEGHNDWKLPLVEPPIWRLAKDKQPFVKMQWASQCDLKSLHFWHNSHPNGGQNLEAQNTMECVILLSQAKNRPDSPVFPFFLTNSRPFFFVGESLRVILILI